MTNIIVISIFWLLSLASFGLAVRPCVRMFERQREKRYGWISSLLVVLLSIYWTVGFTALGICGLDVCPQYGGHPLRELALWVMPPVTVAILLTSVFAYPILGAALAVIAAATYSSCKRLAAYRKG